MDKLPIYFQNPRHIRRTTPPGVQILCHGPLHRCAATNIAGIHCNFSVSAGSWKTEIMSAAILNIRWTDHEGTGPLSIPSGGDFLSTRIGVRLREQHCPSCNSIVYSRRQSRSGVCEQDLPERLLFSRAEAERVDVLLRTERERHRVWLMRVEARPQ